VNFAKTLASDVRVAPAYLHGDCTLAIKKVKFR